MTPGSSGPFYPLCCFSFSSQKREKGRDKRKRWVRREREMEEPTFMCTHEHTRTHTCASTLIPPELVLREKRRCGCVLGGGGSPGGIAWAPPSGCRPGKRPVMAGPLPAGRVDLRYPQPLFAQLPTAFATSSFRARETAGRDLPGLH